MRHALRLLVRVVALACAGVAGYFVWKNPESGAIDARARAGASGQFVPLSHGITHYETAGPDTARTVVLVHGFSVPYYIWDSTFAAVRGAGYRVIRYDVYGRGLSDRPDAAYDGALYDAQLDELLDSLHVTRPVDLMGVSFGGFVTAHYVRTHPARVHTLTLVDPVAKRFDLPEALRIRGVGYYMWQTMHVPAMAENQASDFLHPERFPGWADRYRPQMKFDGFGRALLRTAITLSTMDVDSLYGGVARTGVPTLLVWGRQDQTVPFALSDTVRRSMPGAEFLAVDSSGHLPILEQSAPVHAAILAFLAGHPPA